MTLPTLTWVQSAFQTTGFLAPTDAQVLTAIQTLITASTYWEVKSSGANFLEVGPKAGSAIPNFKAIICDNPTTGYGANATASNGIWCGIAPDGGTLGGYKSATPFGASRFSLYWLGLKTAVVESVYIIESDEVLMVFGYDDSASQMFNFTFGAFVEPNGAVAEADGRIYGMFVSGVSQIGGDFFANNDRWTGYSAINNQSHLGVFRPISPTIFDTGLHPETIFPSSTLLLADVNGKAFALPMHISTRQAPYYTAGKFRQMYVYQDKITRTVISDATGIVGYCAGANVAVAYDALLVANR